jgi:hypothetical protein
VDAPPGLRHGRVRARSTISTGYGRGGGRRQGRSAAGSHVIPSLNAVARAEQASPSTIICLILRILPLIFAAPVGSFMDAILRPGTVVAV